MNSEDYQKNISEFMEKHGIDGFLELYFTKFLFKALKFQMRSKLDNSTDLERDPGIVFYLQDGKIASVEDIEKFEEDLTEICNKAAKEIIKRLKKDAQFKDIFDGNIEKIKDEKLEGIFTKRLHEIIEELSSAK